MFPLRCTVFPLRVLKHVALYRILFTVETRKYPSDVLSILRHLTEVSLDPPTSIDRSGYFNS